MFSKNKNKDEGKYLESLILEYASLMQKASLGLTIASDENDIKRSLVQEADWTEEGAETLLMLVNDYGAFMLRNALALSVVLKKEDGNKLY